MSVRRSISVACAVICSGQHVLAVRRGPSMSMAGKWEFPGGKIEEGESVIQCIERELWEELRIRVLATEELPSTVYDYPSVTITLHPMRAEIASRSIILVEHSEARWLSPSSLHTLDWSEADLSLVDYLKRA